MAAPILRAKGEDTFDGPTDRHLSEDYPASRNGHPQSSSSTWLYDTVSERIATLSVLVEEAAVRLFGDAARGNGIKPG